MPDNIWDNLAFISATIIIVAFYWLYLCPQIVDKVMEKLEQTGWFLIFKNTKKIRCKYVVVFFEFIFLLIMILTLLAVQFRENAYLFICQCILYFFATFARLLRKEFPQYPSIGGKLERIRVKPLIRSIVNEFIGMLFWVLPVAIVIVIFFHLHWPNGVFFIGFLIFPVFFNLWIYSPSKEIKKEYIEARKFVTYCILCVVVIIDVYNKFEGVIGLELTGNKIPQFYFIQVSVLFIAIERVVKSVNDYEKFSKE